jgi:WD40 repeat protein
MMRIKMQSLQALKMLFIILAASTSLISQNKIKEINTLLGHNSEVKCVVFSPDNKTIASGSNDKVIKLWNSESGKLIADFIGHTEAVTSLAFSKDGSVLVSSSNDKTIKVWDITTQKEKLTLAGNTGYINCIVISMDNKIILSGSSDKIIKVWDIETGKEILSHNLDGSIYSIAITSKNIVAAGTNTDKIVLFDLNKKSEIKTMMSNSTSSVNSLAFSPDEQKIAAGYSDKVVRIWDVNNGTIIKSIKDHWDVVNSLFYTSDGKILVTGSSDKTIAVWNTDDYSNIQTLKGHNEKVSTVTINPSNTLIAAGGTENSVIIFQVNSANDLALNQNRNTNQKAPRIFIFEPRVSRGLKLSSNEKTISVKGKVEDDKGVFEVLVNNTEAKLQSSGEFSAEIKLGLGENTITVKATDTENNISEETFTIVREGGTIETTITENNLDNITSTGIYYALLIGVDQYTDKNINTLVNPVKDAKQIKEVLISNYTFNENNVTFLKNPGRVELLGAFEKMRKKITPNDNLLIFYAGHGYWDAEISQGYWLPSDAYKDNRANWISNADIRDNIRGIKSKHTLLISDACFSGGIFRTRAAFNNAPSAIQEVYKMTSRKGMTSGTLTEVADESVFLKYFIKRLKENTQDFYTAEEIFTSLKTAVINNSKQVPQYGEIQDAGDEGGDFVFIRKK